MSIFQWKHLKTSLKKTSLLAYILAAESAFSCVITMGYRTNAREPLIKASPNHEGLYFDLYSKAAKNIGCELKVVRAPKERINKGLQEGIIDFYPGYNFTEDRANFAYFIQNGLPGGEVGVSKSSFKNVTDINRDLEGKTLLVVKGGLDFVENPKIRKRSLSDVSVDKAIEYIRQDLADFYIYNRSTLEYYVKKMAHKDIKIHPNCCGKPKPLYLGFSRRGKNYKEVANSSFNTKMVQSPKNFPVKLKLGSVAQKFEAELNKLSQKGYTNDLYNKYFK